MSSPTCKRDLLVFGDARGQLGARGPHGRGVEGRRRQRRARKRKHAVRIFGKRFDLKAYVARIDRK